MFQAKNTSKVWSPAPLAKAFRGELVLQNPNNEPASMLLERIRKARAVAEEAGVKKGQRGALTKPTRTRPKEDPMLEINQVQADHLTSIFKGLDPSRVD